ncbi:amidase [Tranquillimonas alkanivorans]|uniref:Aspartyl-tRNA(Asn)/glutamyl-tRNA(Gln) amidotransferase subunit A n=1 Tax=Tranquillimonas alkanivorans TaxID=441119 RepID=A0A1I5UP31_9RHOB|nr:amidase [Tranquillimonas alkanivorans]SFP96827.1 aspartyl-tRNA(Asn)/glutamyl-tRNA(Gln) amidotransferase subunit A [Tranquillimonas alkanivorans]
MVDDQFLDWDTEELSAGVRTQRFTSEAVVAASLQRIAERNDALHAFVEVFDASARQRARELDAEIRDGRWRGPLHGLPVAIKDLADIEGHVTGFGSRCYSDTPAMKSAAFVQALEQAGAVIIGKTHTVEFAFGSWGTNYALGTPVNPACPGHCSPGGSSSGSAVAVAAGLVPLAIGSDTGGSVRIPSALCGITGMKPSHGAVSLDGVAPLSARLDAIGPLARDVAGLKMLLDAMSLNQPSGAAVTPANVWCLAEGDLQPADAAVLSMYAYVLEALRTAGFDVERLELPRALSEYQSRCGSIMAYDAYRALREIIEDHRRPLDPWVRRRIAAGRDISDEAQEEALRQREKDTEVFLERFGPDDLLVLPTTPLTARPVAEIDEMQIPMSRFTRIANYLDLAAVTLPVVRPGEAPVGVQVAARRGQDDRLLALLREHEPLSQVIAALGQRSLAG